VAAEVLNDLGRHLYLVRMARGLTQRVVAAALEVHYTMISHMERGKGRAPGLQVVVRMLRWLSASLDEPIDGPTDREVIGDETRDP
jgi:transcriptional regulator with XRE-family HTH domain